MNISKIIISNNPNRQIITLAVNILKKGGVLIIPTETAYGLAADATNREAVKKIYQIKGRNFNKFLPLIASSINQVKKYFKPTSKEVELFKKYPGLSIVVSPKHENTKALKQNVYLMPGQDSCVVRISTNEICKLLVRRLGRPITATSANKAGGDNCYSAEEVIRQLKNSKQQPNLIFDAGKLKLIKPSTIIEVESNKINVIRQGKIRITRSC